MDAKRSLCHPSEPSYRERSKRRNPLPHLHWLAVAVGLCWLSWPAPAEAQPACSHDVCEVGPALNSNCDPCVTDICAGDPYCCAVEWDDSCIEQVLTVCGDPTCAAICSHNPCEVGEPLDSTCNSCTALVCWSNPGCCDPLTGSWSQVCVNEVENLCGFQCEPGADTCSNAVPIVPGKIYGTLLGASNDGCASENGSGGAGVSCRSADVWYSYTQGVADDMVLSTCATQRSFGIDTTLSVHTGCPGRTNNEIVSNDDHLLGYVPNACIIDPSPKNLDSAVSLGGFFALDPGETVVIRVSHHDDSVPNDFELRILPEPGSWLALVAGAGALSALSRRRARR